MYHHRTGLLGAHKSTKASSNNCNNSVAYVQQCDIFSPVFGMIIYGSVVFLQLYNKPRTSQQNPAPVVSSSSSSVKSESSGKSNHNIIILVCGEQTKKILITRWKKCLKSVLSEVTKNNIVIKRCPHLKQYLKFPPTQGKKIISPPCIPWQISGGHIAIHKDCQHTGKRNVHRKYTKKFVDVCWPWLIVPIFKMKYIPTYCCFFDLKVEVRLASLQKVIKTLMTLACHSILTSSTWHSKYTSAMSRTSNSPQVRTGLQNYTPVRFGVNFLYVYETWFSSRNEIWTKLVLSGFYYGAGLFMIRVILHCKTCWVAISS